MVFIDDFDRATIRLLKTARLKIAAKEARGSRGNEKGEKGAGSKPEAVTSIFLATTAIFTLPCGRPETLSAAADAATGPGLREKQFAGWFKFVKRPS